MLIIFFCNFSNYLCNVVSDYLVMNYLMMPLTYLKFLFKLYSLAIIIKRGMLTQLLIINVV